MLSQFEQFQEKFHCHNNHDIARRACQLEGENDPIWIRTVTHALDIGDYPQIVRKAVEHTIGNFGENNPPLH